MPLIASAVTKSSTATRTRELSVADGIRDPVVSGRAVGTDPRQAVNFATREITLGQQTQPLGAWIKLMTDKIVGQYTADPKNARARSDQLRPEQ